MDHQGENPSRQAKSRLEGNDFDRVYTEFYPVIYRVAVKVVGEPHAAEELCQEAFLRYFERMDKLPRNREALYWLIRVVKNLAYNHEKRQGRKRKAYERFQQESSYSEENRGETGVMADQTVEMVRRALLELPSKLRIPLVLKEYAGFNYDEIAKTMKISVGNVKVRIHRGRQKMAQMLDKGDLYVP